MQNSFSEFLSYECKCPMSALKIALCNRPCLQSVVQHSDHCHTKRQSCSSGTQAPTQRANGPSLAKGRPPSSSHPRGLSSLDVGAVYKGSQEDLVTNLKDWHNREYPHQVLYIRARHASQLVVVCKEKRMHMHCEFLVAFKAMDDGSGFRVTQVSTMPLAY